MTEDDIMQAAQKAGPLTQGPFDKWCQRFANLVAAHKAEVALAEAYRCGYKDGMEAGSVICENLPVQESVSMRMPKVGDKVICLEDESFGEVVSLTAGGSPDILFADGSHGTYLLREFAELFGYVASPLPVQPEPVTWDKPSDNFNDWWDVDYEDPANPFEKDSAAYWAWAGWKAAQRPWVGLTEEDYAALSLAVAANKHQCRAIEAKLKAKNHG